MLAKQQTSQLKSCPSTNIDTSMSDSINYRKSVAFHSGTDESNAMATEENDSVLA